MCVPINGHHLDIKITLDEVPGGKLYFSPDGCNYVLKDVSANTILPYATVTGKRTNFVAFPR